MPNLLLHHAQCTKYGGTQQIVFIKAESEYPLMHPLNARVVQSRDRVVASISQYRHCKSVEQPVQALASCMCVLQWWSHRAGVGFITKVDSRQRWRRDVGSVIPHDLSALPNVGGGLQYLVVGRDPHDPLDRTRFLTSIAFTSPCTFRSSGRYAPAALISASNSSLPVPSQL